MSRKIHIPNFKSISQKTGEKVRKTKFLKRAITQVKVGHTRQKSNLISIMSRQIYKPNFISISQRQEEKVRKTKFFAKDNNSSKSKSNETKVTLDLHYVRAKPYTKFQVNISKDN